MRSSLKKAGRFFLYVLAFLVSATLLTIGLATLKYKTIVAAMPQNSSAHAQPGELGQLVNTFIGTGGFPYWVGGFNFPGATVPFGMIRLSPETMSIYKDTKDFSTAGYYYADTKILGFSHTRLAGTGATEGGHFLFTPTTRPLDKIDFSKDYVHHFSHAEETAFPGYYSVKFKDEQILSEFTTTERTGIHRYTFPEKSNKRILVHITNTLGDAKAENGKVRIRPQSNEIEGSVRTYGSFAGRYGGIEVYFVARFDCAFEDYGIWDGTKYEQKQNQALSNSLKVNLSFKKNSINVQVGISYTSIENARLNLDTETKHTSFDTILASAKTKWEEKLSLIQIDGGSTEEKKVFYSSLYRCFQMPTIFNDVNGDYMGFDNKIHQTTDFTYYTDFSLWDTFRTVHPLFNLIA
ncbi:MAG: glycoside hydrolase family 92 protein, partial [Flavobacteriaceae bacterium]